MEFEEQRRRAIAVMQRKGFSRSATEAPYRQVFRALGFQVRPMPVESFWRVVLVCGGGFAPFWGLAMWFWRWRDEGMRWPIAILVALLTGFFFGLSMACYMAYTRKKHGLPTWESLASTDASRAG